MPSDYTIDSEQRREIARQIGPGTVLSISGGRMFAIPDGIELPVDCGYRVRVRLTPADTYTVERVLVRGAKQFAKGERGNVYADEVGEVAYRAGMFRSYDENEWVGLSVNREEQEAMEKLSAEAEAADALSHLGAEVVEAAGGFTAVRVPSGTGEILVGLGDGSEPGWTVVDESGEEHRNIAGEDLVATVAELVAA
jgi:hypothetical protein